MDEKELLIQWLEESKENQEVALEALHYVSEVLLETKGEVEGIDDPANTYDRINVLKERCGYTIFPRTNE